jgi:hypothetical protein
MASGQDAHELRARQASDSVSQSSSSREEIADAFGDLGGVRL